MDGFIHQFTRQRKMIKILNMMMMTMLE